MDEIKFKQDKEVIVLGSLIILGRLGQGSTSHVFKTQSIKTKQLYAMKVIDKKSPDYSPKAIQNQVSIHEKLSHRHISHFIAHLQDTDNHYLLTEYCEGGEVTKILLEEPNEKRIIQIAYELCLSLDYLHSELNISHGDLKLNNILLKKSSIKLCDFGYSQELSGSVSNGSFGTLIYMSPQTITKKQRKYHKEADIWSLGIILLTLMIRKRPYKSQNYQQLKKQITSSSYLLPSEDQYSRQLRQFVQYILNPKHQERPTIKQILGNSIFLNNLRSCHLLNAHNLKIKEQQKLSDQQLKTPIKKQIQKPLPDVDMEETIKKLPEENMDFDKTVCKNEKLKKFISVSLHPLFHKTKNDGELQISQNKDIYIKIKDVKYTISSFGDTLTLFKKKNSMKVYQFQQIQQNQKIKNLYKYARDLVSFVKKNQGIKEFYYKECYFWIKKNTKILNFIHKSGTTLTHDLKQDKITIKKESQMTISMEEMQRMKEDDEVLGMFGEGEKFFLSKLQQYN